MMNKMLYPSEVCVAHRRHAVLPTNIFTQTITAPVAIIEMRIRENIVRFQVFVLIAMKRISGLNTQVSFDSSQREVHLRQPPSCRVAFLAKDRDITFGLAAVAVSRLVGANELFTQHKHAARATA